MVQDESGTDSSGLVGQGSRSRNKMVNSKVLVISGVAFQVVLMQVSDIPGSAGTKTHGLGNIIIP